MLSDISLGGWLIILSSMAIGFGLVRFLVASMNGKIESSAPKQEQASEDLSGFGKRGEKRDSSANSSNSAKPEFNRAPPDWHEVLGVNENAPIDQIRTAYRKKMALYHPDKVSALGPEFSVVAERITKEINAAYERGIASRS
jgi:DnaJ-domain-containing protein 1